ncbi:MAG: pyruvate kinase [Nitrospirae bacterium]|nr:pyruvate kinase [Nitrospirota bacterium]
MRKAKIVCTIGPASGSKSVVHQMIKAGMNVARLNFSHGTYETHKNAVELIRSCARQSGSPVAILQDLKGLKIRIGSVKDGAVRIEKGSALKLTTKNILGSDKLVQIQYPHLMKDLKTGSAVLIDDGLIQLRVIKKEKDRLTAEVIEGGILKEKKGVNLPNVRISASTFTKKDMDDLSFGIKLGVDYIALSFVCSKKDILKVKNFLKKQRSDIPVIAKIETRQALENIEDIIDVSDGIMIARGDLGVELPTEEVPLIQKRLIGLCNSALKPVIIATQMLESMTGHLRPTRAEATDVANGVLDGADALMLSAETSAGKYPVEAVEMMDRIISFTEEHGIIPPLEKGGNTPLNPLLIEGKIVPLWERGMQGDFEIKTFAHAIAEAACSSSSNIDAKAIVAFSRSGFTALLVSKFRPQVPVICFTDTENVRRRMSLYWGVKPHVMKFPGNTDDMIFESEKALLQKGIVKKGDAIAIIAAAHFALGGKSNIMKLHRVGL